MDMGTFLKNRKTMTHGVFFSRFSGALKSYNIPNFKLLRASMSHWAKAANRIKQEAQGSQ